MIQLLFIKIIKNTICTEEVRKNLSALLAKNYDADAGCKTAINQVANLQLKSFFGEQSQDGHKSGHELKAALKSHGQEPDKATSMTGNLHRAQMNIKSYSSDESKSI